MEKKIALYPFLPESQNFVDEEDIGLVDLLENPRFASARSRARRRVKWSIEKGRIPPAENLDKELDRHSELFSYILSRLIVSCIKDDYLVKRYALSESKTFYSRIYRETSLEVKEIANSLGIESAITEQDFIVSLVDYLKSSSPLKEKSWKLVNRKIKSGKVFLTEKKFRRMLQEVVRKKIEEDLPLDVPDEVQSKLKYILEDIMQTLEKRESKFELDFEGIVDKELFPPCMNKIVSDARASRNLSHTERFAIVSFLININVGYNKILDIFKSSPDFDDERTSYQVKHIAGNHSENKYKPPSCETLKTYGICVSPDWRCDRVSHPLGYYSWSLKSRKENENQD